MLVERQEEGCGAEGEAEQAADPQGLEFEDAAGDEGAEAVQPHQQWVAGFEADFGGNGQGQQQHDQKSDPYVLHGGIDVGADVPLALLARTDDGGSNGC